VVCVLQRLLRLTNPAAVGKFSYLVVVSGLTNLRQLASAALMRKVGWQVGLRGLMGGGGCWVWVVEVRCFAQARDWVGRLAWLGMDGAPDRTPGLFDQTCNLQKKP
jgi:hypothetical protein